MANQIISVTGNIGAQPTFKQGEYNLVEFIVISEEFKRDENGELVPRNGTQQLYQVTAWGGDNPQNLDVLKALKKGMRVHVEGQFKAGLFTRENGETGIGLSVSCRPADISVKLNRIDDIVMRPPRQRDDQSAAKTQTQSQEPEFDEQDVPY